MARQKQPPQQPPPALKLVLRYAKRGRMRFTSHRDFARVFERALRRAGVPLALSSGFHPHPRISYANPAPTGALSEAEFVEIGLSERRDPSDVVEALNAHLPEGFVVLEAGESAVSSLTRFLDGSRWEAVVEEADAAIVAPASIDRYLAADEALATRLTKNGERTFDTRPAVLNLTTTGDRTCAMTLRHEEPLVRPDDVVAAAAGLLGHTLTSPPLLKRTGHGHLDAEGTLTSPLRQPE
ncbi:MAG: TIGR03936 family radical SAM-associated protein [Propionibacteriaceae bacterium]|jgi:radical SAM-linked protein|nr:TIGR03936 family radical SAM-associated protein [Propionibacteriaceae bacterium]